MRSLFPAKLRKTNFAPSRSFWRSVVQFKRISRHNWRSCCTPASAKRDAIPVQSSVVLPFWPCFVCECLSFFLLSVLATVAKVQFASDWGLTELLSFPHPVRKATIEPCAIEAREKGDAGLLLAAARNDHSSPPSAFWHAFFCSSSRYRIFSLFTY